MFSPVRWQIFFVSIYVICECYIHKTDSADLTSFNIFLEIFTANLKYLLTLNQEFYNLSKPNSLCFGKISKFPVFSLTGNIFWPFSLFSLCRGYAVLYNKLRSPNSGRLPAKTGGLTGLNSSHNCTHTCY